MVAALAALAFGASSAVAKDTCGGFKVLHDDRIGPAKLPAGTYSVIAAEDLGCEAASKLFARFLQDWDGNLPRPWRVSAERSGVASFSRGGGLGGFTVRLTGGGGGTNPELGKLCPGTFTVNTGSDVGPLYFVKGRYLLYIPARSGITCRRASVLFTRFLAAPAGMLPSPWRVLTQTATFYKPANPTRSAFRVEPEAGVS
ncbi:MAG: hypothetical protein ACJ76B_11940 [Solirubrobacterales bacterium]